MIIKFFIKQMTKRRDALLAECQKWSEEAECEGSGHDPLAGYYAKYYELRAAGVQKRIDQLQGV